MSLSLFTERVQRIYNKVRQKETEFCHSAISPGGEKGGIATTEKKKELAIVTVSRS